MAAETVGDFELLEFLASGSVGDVYRARHQQSRQPVVIKFLQDSMAGEPELQRRFVREVSIAEKLKHPNIVRHYDSGLHDDRIFFAMELVECGTLKDVLQRRGRLPWREAVECAIQVCAALDYAHQSGVIHRDLKPANLFLAENGSVKVGDFGLARDLNSTRLTIQGQTVGTCRYMPPEQIAGEGALTGATDLYALGCILYEMLTGRTPFDGRTIVEIFEAHLNHEARPPAELLRDCPADLSELTMLLLIKRPQERPDNAAAVRAALVDVLHGRPMQLTPRPADDVEADLKAVTPPDAPNLTQRLHSLTSTAPLADTSLPILVGVVIAAAIVVSVAMAWLLR